MTTVTILTDAPADPATVTEYGDALPELVRALVHVTRHQEAMEEPADADRLIRNLSSAASGMAQLAGQVAGWVEAEQAAGRIGLADGSRFTGTAHAARVARRQLEQAQAYARMLQQALDAAAEATSGMKTAGEDGSHEA